MESVVWCSAILSNVKYQYLHHTRNPVFLSTSQMQITLYTPGLRVWDSNVLERIQFIMLWGHRHLLFSFYNLPGVILRVGVSSEVETSSCFRGVYQQRHATNQERNEKKKIRAWKWGEGRSPLAHEAVERFRAWLGPRPNDRLTPLKPTRTAQGQLMGNSLWTRNNGEKSMTGRDLSHSLLTGLWPITVKCKG